VLAKSTGIVGDTGGIAPGTYRLHAAESSLVEFEGPCRLPEEHMMYSILALLAGGLLGLGLVLVAELSMAGPSSIPVLARRSMVHDADAEVPSLVAGVALPSEPLHDH